MKPYHNPGLAARLAGCLVSVALYALAFPCFYLWPLAFVALAPLFWSLDRSGSARSRFFLGAVFGGLFAAGMAYFLPGALIHEYEKSVALSVFFLAVFVAMPYGLLYGLFGLAFGAFRRRGLAFYACAVPSLWVLGDQAKELVPVLAPWANIACAALPCPWFTQAADVAGAQGLTFLIVSANGLAVFLAMRGGRSRAGLLALALVVGAPIAYGAVRLPLVQREVDAGLKDAGRACTATLAQADFSLRQRWSGLGFHNRVRTYLDLSGLLNQPPRHVLVWSETVLNSLADVNAGFFASLAQDIGPDSLLVTGGLRRAQEGGGVYNSVYFISGSGRVTWYDKNILLPYAETAPLGDILGDYSGAPSEFVPGATPPCVRTPLGPAGVLICFESLYSGYVRQAVLGGAGFFVNLSNDAWFGRTSMPFMHLDAVRMRAIENRRFVLRGANSGISAVISPTGEVLAQTRLFERQSVSCKFFPIAKQSLFSRIGNWVPVLAFFYVVFAGLAPLVFQGRR